MTFNDIVANPMLAHSAEGVALIEELVARFPYFTLGRMFGVRVGVESAQEFATRSLSNAYPSIFYQIEQPAAGVSQSANEDLVAPFLEQNDNLLSETLAAIFASQGNINRAIEIYMKLSLKNPEKSRYFADQISSLQNRGTR